MNNLGNFFLLALSQRATAHDLIGENGKLMPDHTCDYLQEEVWWSMSSFEQGDNGMIKAQNQCFSDCQTKARGFLSNYKCSDNNSV